MYNHFPHTKILLVLSSLLYASIAKAADVNLFERQNGCVTTGFVPCPPNSDSTTVTGAPAAAFGGPGFWDSLESAASNPIQVKHKLRRDLMERQSALCCRPAPVECLVTNDGNVPFCYTPSTTRYFFSDGSYGFVSNGTYYGVDGSFVDFNTGQYTFANGTNGTFAPATSAATSSVQSTSPTVTASSTPVLVSSSSILASTSPASSSSSSRETKSAVTAAASPTASKSSSPGRLLVGYDFNEYRSISALLTVGFAFFIFA